MNILVERLIITKQKFMKKLLTLVVGMMFAATMIAGGLVTNTNQSATWVRLPARDASTSIDAVYFNPAGLMKLNNGFHFSVSNQSIMQTKEVLSSYPNLNEPLYTGKVSAPLFPTVYAVYKMEKLAFSFGFNPVGGGGSAVFEDGLPSFDMGPSDLVPVLASQGAIAYRLNSNFEGSSTYFGYQGGISYKINDMISVFAGVRYVNAKNTYDGYLTDIELEMGGGLWMRADGIFTGTAAQASGAADGMQPLIDGGAGTLTFAQAEGLTAINAIQRATLEGGLLAFGVPQASIDAMTLAEAQGTYTSLAGRYTATSMLLADQTAETEQTASGITPIIGLNISPIDKLNIGIKYEFATKLEFTNNTTQEILTDFEADGTPITLFPDGATFRGDMPAMLSVGVDYRITNALKVSCGTHYYFDKAANYGKKIDDVYVENSEVIDNNFFELALGLEYGVGEKILLSGGFLYAKTGVNNDYQSDLSYSLTSSTTGLGGAYVISDKIMLNLGFGYTMYVDSEATIDHLFKATETVIPVIETYSKSNMFVAVGLDFSF
jgi:long-subunit fatty acid transport protein